MKKAYLVVGPESSGTRMMTEIFVKGGCFGDFTHDQKLDNGDESNFKKDLIVWRRSYPHGGQWPDLEFMYNYLKGRHYKVYVVVMTRDMHAMALSQVKTWKRVYDGAINSIRTAYATIFSQLLRANLPYIVVSYESLVQRGIEVLKKTLPLIDFEAPESFEFYDGNEKWYE